VYPADLFVRRKKYDTPVFQSRHPALNEYISGAVKAIGEELVLVTHAHDAIILSGLLADLKNAGKCRQGGRSDQGQRRYCSRAFYIFSAEYDTSRDVPEGLKASYTTCLFFCLAFLDSPVFWL
jgi:hypothetical protein